MPKTGPSNAIKNALAEKIAAHENFTIRQAAEQMKTTAADVLKTFKTELESHKATALCGCESDIAAAKIKADGLLQKFSEIESSCQKSLDLLVRTGVQLDNTVDRLTQTWRLLRRLLFATVVIPIVIIFAWMISSTTHKLPSNQHTNFQTNSQ